MELESRILLPIVLTHCILHSIYTYYFRRVQGKLGDEANRVSKMKWYSYLTLLLMYIIYLAIGAFIFQTFEKPHEVIINLDLRTMFNHPHALVCFKTHIEFSQRY